MYIELIWRILIISADVNLFKTDAENMKNTHGGELLLLKVTLLHGCFSRFFKLYK